MFSSAQLNRIICTNCGIQFDTSDAATIKNRCHICNDPRFCVPPTGQTWTTLSKLTADGHKNKWAQVGNSKVWSIWTEPKVGIGERACLLQTPSGNILWDLVPFIDTDTVDWINSIGGLKAIVISHPHYYTTVGTWSEVFKCEVYLSKEDRAFLENTPVKNVKFIEQDTIEISKGVTAIKAGGHFDGSLVVHWDGHLFHADTFLISMSGLSSMERQPGYVTYSFMYSPPNMIPLCADAIEKIWISVKPFEFTSTHGAFHGQTVTGNGLKQRLLESAQQHIRYQGHKEHSLFLERLE